MTKPRIKNLEEMTAEIEDGKKKIRQFENREKRLRQKLFREERRERNHRLILEIRAQIGKLKEWITDLFKARGNAPEQTPQSPKLANLLMKYLSVQRKEPEIFAELATAARSR